MDDLLEMLEEESAVVTEFLVLFDSTGERSDTIPCDKDLTDERKQELISRGYEIVSVDDWNLIIGNVDGQERIKDVTHGGYIIKPKYATLDDAKTAKIKELKAVRDAKEVEPVQTDKGIFDYDDKSRDRLAIARQALTDNGGGEIVWTTADNQRVPMTIADFAAINGQAAIRSNALHVRYNELKELVNACQTVAEVENIVWR